MQFRILSLLAATATLFALTFAAPVFAQTPSEIPRKIPTADFAARPLISGPLLSPDASMMIARMNIQGVERLGIHSFSGAALRTIKLPEKSDLRWYRWAGNGRILISVGQMVPVYYTEIYVSRLMSFDLKSRTFSNVGLKGEGPEGDDLLYVAPGGDWLLLSLQKTIYDYPAVYRFDLATGASQLVVKQRSDVWEWYADEDGVVRAGVGFSAKAWSMVYRKNEGGKFEKVGKARYDDESAALDILAFARGSDEGYVLDNRETGRFALYKFDFATKTLGEKVFAHDTNDVSKFSVASDGKSLNAVWYTDERDRIRWFDPVMAKVQSDIDAAIKQNENWIVSKTEDSGAMIVWTGASNNPGSYYMYRPAVGRMQIVSKINDRLQPKELAPTQYIRYPARDGLEIPAYLTLPRGRPAKNLPLIILPHGGPFDVRDTPDFSAEVQMLANRGYAVLQPNFRGSGGYGKAYYEKGDGEWGRKMQDDLDDGMDWLAKQGQIDPKRVCIVGGSYGGYAALWGVTRNPERYRCAASFAGVTDLGKQLKFQLVGLAYSKRYAKDWRLKVKGAEEFDAKSVSPLHNVDRLTRPVLLVHGDSDQTVPYAQSKLYADALTKAKRPVEFITLTDEGHGFSTSANLQSWLDALDSFLAKHNPA